MHISHLRFIATLLAFFTIASSFQLPTDLTASSTDLSKRDPLPRGGGGRGGFGGIGGGRTGGSSRPPPNTLGNSNRGGRTSSGSGVPPSYGGFYAGGSRVPYRSGVVGRGGIAPFLLIGGGLGFWAGSGWGPYGAYAYEFPANVTFKNATTGKRESLPALCLCRRFAECSCAVNGGDRYVRAVLGDGSYSYLRNHDDVVQVNEVNGTRTIVLNGTLANGTTASGTAGAGRRGMLENAVWAAGSAAVGWAVWAL